MTRTTTGTARPAARRVPTVVMLVGGLHLLLIAAVLECEAARNARRPTPPQVPRIALRLIIAPLPDRPPPAEAPPQAEAAVGGARKLPRRADPPTPASRGQTVTARRDRAGSSPSGPLVDRAAASAEPRLDAGSVEPPPAAAVAVQPSILDTEATRRAIGVSARTAGLARRAAEVSEAATASSVGERLGTAIRGAGQGDCLRGDYAGSGMGLLSVPFLAAAVLGDRCAQ